VSEDEFAQLAGTVRDYEPRLALVAEQGPLELLRELVRQSALHLVPGGQLCFEISPMLAGQVEAMTGGESYWGPPELIKDLSGQVRVVLLKRSIEEK
jgi:methylase of polypeptide subunit release factors